MTTPRSRSRSRHVVASVGILILAALLSTSPLLAQGIAQWNPLKRGSDNIEVLGHLPLGPHNNLADMEVEQELSRPYAYVARARYDGLGPVGMAIIDISDPERPTKITEWQIENQDLHIGGARDVKYFKWNDRYYVVQSLQFRQGGPNSDLGAVVLDVTGLPDPSSVREVARIREPDLPGGFHNIFIYKHSNGRVYLMTTVSGPFANLYDLGTLVEDGPENAFAGRVPVPQGGPNSRGYHDIYAGYHPDTGQDRFYGGGTGGYYVYDITDLDDPSLLVTLTGINGIQRGHTFTPSPDGRYAIAESEYQYAPLRIFDMKPALDGEVTNIRSPIAGWTADWENLVHNHEVRWPFVFVSGYLDGLQVFSMADPKNPQTVAFYDTYLGSTATNKGSVMGGAFGVDVRNEDGLILVSDQSTGLWIFRMEGFQGWNGEDWGMPDISSVQKWDSPVPGRPIS
ncbi:MAG: LVIVD repeat-containing protein [Gemmatimonadota bacterium]